MECSYDTVRPQELPGGGNGIYHRKRSSSLPRILPPILDDDDDEQESVVQEGHRRDQVQCPCCFSRQRHSRQAEKNDLTMLCNQWVSPIKAPRSLITTGHCLRAYNRLATTYTCQIVIS